MNNKISLEPPFDLLPKLYHFIHEEQVSVGNYSSGIEDFSAQALCALLHAKLRTMPVDDTDQSNELLNKHLQAIEDIVDLFSMFNGGFRGVKVNRKFKWDRSILKNNMLFADLNKKGRG